MLSFEEPSAALNALLVDSDAVQGNADFFDAYARRLEEATPTSQQRGSEPNNDAWIALSRSSEPWLAHGIIASAYAQSAQFRFLLDIDAAISTMRRAARAYLNAGHPYGLFLMSAAMSPSEATELLMTPAYRDALESERRTRTDLAISTLEDPVQRTYLLLSYCMLPVARAESRRLLLQLHEQLEPHGRHPIGSQGVPIAEYLALSFHALREERRRDGDRDWLSGFSRPLLNINQQQATALQVARGNAYLWTRGAAPVNYSDLELIALVSLVMRASGSPQLMSAELDRHISNPVAAVTPWLGVELSSRAEGQASGSEESP